MASRPLLLAGLLLSSIVGCTHASDEVSAASADELAVERVTLPTLHAQLRAGDPYSPILDEPPLPITGAEPCLASPRVVTTPGTTAVEAAIVSTRRELLQRLDLGVEGMPLNIGRLVGASGAARLAMETKVGEGSLTLMFQAKGTFESTIAELGAAPAPFDPSRIDRCGWGYVKKAYHRLSAVVAVTIESHDRTSRVRLGCGADESGCTPTRISAGPASARAALEHTLRSGSYDIAVRSVADVIPGLEPTPLGDMVALSSTPETADAVLQKLGRALDWLGRAQVSIANRVTTLTTGPGLTGGAPTTKVDFAYWPGLSSDIKDRLARSYDDVVVLRNDYERVLARSSTWEAFEDARSQGSAHFYNVPSAPAEDVDELVARANGLLAPDGKLTARRREIESSLGRCEGAVRNEDGATAAGSLVSRIEVACTPPGAPAWEASYDRDYGLRRLSPRSLNVRTYDEWGDNMCPEGQRLPRIEEAKLLAPFSHVTADEQDRGAWLRRENPFAAPVYVKAGKVERVGLFQGPSHVALCFDSGGSLFD